MTEFMRIRGNWIPLRKKHPGRKKKLKATDKRTKAFWINYWK